MATHVLRIDRWHPAAANQYMWKHWRVASRMKKADCRLVEIEAIAQGVPKAEGRRRVDIHIVLKKGQRERDPDAFWKSLNDALKKAGLLTDDNRKGVELGSYTCSRTRDDSHWTVVTLTDVEPAPKIKRHPKVRAVRGGKG